MYIQWNQGNGLFAMFKRLLYHEEIASMYGLKLRLVPLYKDRYFTSNKATKIAQMVLLHRYTNKCLESTYVDMFHYPRIRIKKVLIIQ